MLDELYQESILNHNRAPWHHGEPPHHDCRARGYNATCGDDLMVYVDSNAPDGPQVYFSGDACAVATASASMMASALAGLSPAAMVSLGRAFIAAIEQGASLDACDSRLQTMQPMLSVRQYPGRLGCATLAWNALIKALAP